MRKRHLQILVLVLIFSINQNLFGQSITWGPNNPPGSANPLDVFYSNNTASISFTNDENTPLSNATVEVELGTGIEYVAGTLSYSTSGSATVTELSSTGANPAVFNIGSLAGGEQVFITFARQANCDARDHKIEGLNFSDVFHVYENGVEVNYDNQGGVPYTVGYDVTYANLVFGSVSHSPSSSTAVGAAVTRSVEISNGAFGSIDEFWFEDMHIDANIDLSDFQINGYMVPSANITMVGGMLRIKVDTSLLPFVDGSNGTNGNGNTVFETDEYFVLNYKVRPLNCGTVSELESDMDIFYGEDVNTPCDPSSSLKAGVTISNGGHPLLSPK